MKELRLYAWRRRGRQLTVAAGITGPTIGVNLHRRGGLSLTGVPRSGGITVAWGELRRQGDEWDKAVAAFSDRRRVVLGPVAIRVGRDF